ncbi:MAG: PadR family transcriptional regulator [Candidatus Izemoplasmatales bacterium]|jgi:DNA-binding PadR family transcriptional regulator|nr:PadR family transcriptional regulator [Candidatus Izemoplasmatales bacterium]MDD3865672.1 PadR family transcriptional regulator [Candidatus Izemoplasmatales bacterium]
MNKQIVDKYLPMTETAYYILLALKKPLHGYGIILAVERMTNQRIRIGAGTIYGTLTKMETDDLIKPIREEDRRKIYIQTDLGSQLLQLEINRLQELYENGIKAGDNNEKI